MVRDWELDKVYHMDCIEGLQMSGSDSVDFVLTSPPLYSDESYGQWNSYSEYIEFMKSVFTEVHRVVKGGRYVAVTCSVDMVKGKTEDSEGRSIPIPFHIVKILEKVGFRFKEDIVVVRNKGGNRLEQFIRTKMPFDYKPNRVIEYVLLFQKKGQNGISVSDEQVSESIVGSVFERTNVWMVDEDKDSDHPERFSVSACQKLIRYYSFVDEVVLDVFAGVGTTAVASVQEGRYYIGFEIAENYVVMARKRLKSKRSVFAKARRNRRK